MFQSIEEVLNLVIKWENDLDKYYAHLEKSLKDKRSKVTIHVLKERLDKNLKTLSKINVKEYKHTEFIKNIPNYQSENVIPKVVIKKGSSPIEVFEEILKFEEKLMEFYRHIRDVLVYAKSKELFDMLVQFKMTQIKEIMELMDSHDLAL